MTEAHRPVLALFDFDGTLSTREMLPDFLRYAVSKWRLRFWGPLMLPLVRATRAGWMSGSRLRAILAWVAFRGVSETHFESRGQSFARDVLPTALRPDMMARIAAYQARGDVVVVVSGAYDVYLKHWCQVHGLALIGSSLEVRTGVLTGRYAGAQNVGEEKARRVRAAYALDAFSAVHAYGDTPEDEAMLALADRAFYCGVERPAASAVAT